jgi:hypothetical protein
MIMPSAAGEADHKKEDKSNKTKQNKNGSPGSDYTFYCSPSPNTYSSAKQAIDKSLSLAITSPCPFDRLMDTN